MSALFRQRFLLSTFRMADPHSTAPRLRCLPAAARPPSSANLAGADSDASVHKPHLGKNPHHEGVKTKRDLAHDHHLSRRGKGERGCRVLITWLTFPPLLAVIGLQQRQEEQRGEELTWHTPAGPGPGLLPMFLCGPRPHQEEQRWRESDMAHCQQKLTASHPRRASFSAGTGRTKKSGAGGKFTWGSMLTDGEEATGAMDRNDPNYNSGARLLTHCHVFSHEHAARADRPQLQLRCAAADSSSCVLVMNMLRADRPQLRCRLPSCIIVVSGDRYAGWICW